MGEVFINSDAYKNLVCKINDSVSEIKRVSDVPKSGSDVLSEIINLNDKVVKISKEFGEHIQLDLVPSYKKTETDLLKVDINAKSALRFNGISKGEV